MGKAKGDKSEKISKADAGGTSPEYPDFDLDNPELPPEIEARALPSNDFPYEKTLKRKVYEAELQQLQLELIKLQDHVQAKGERIVVVFEGRDTSGKGASWSASTRAIPAPSLFPSRRRLSAVNGISSATSVTCRRVVTWFCSTGAGTTAPASSA